MRNNGEKSSKSRRAWFLYTAAIVFLNSFPPSASAGEWQDHAALQKAAQLFIDEYYDDSHDVHVKTGYLDRRLRLARCASKLHTFLPSNKPPLGATSVGIRCTSPVWKVHLPVQVRVYRQVVVTKQPLARHAMIQATDLQLQKREISRYYRGTYSDPEQLVGMVVKRPIRQDTVLTPPLVKPRRLVNRGQPVTIIADWQGLRIRARGEALSDGHRGQIIRVENARSGKAVSAEVIGPSTVRVKM